MELSLLDPLNQYDLLKNITQGSLSTVKKCNCKQTECAEVNLFTEVK